MEKIKNFNTGDKFEINCKIYLMAYIEGFYYLINIDTGGTWTNGLDFDGMIYELNNEGAKQL